MDGAQHMKMIYCAITPGINKSRATYSVSRIKSLFLISRAPLGGTWGTLPRATY